MLKKALPVLSLAMLTACGVTGTITANDNQDGGQYGPANPVPRYYTAGGINPQDWMEYEGRMVVTKDRDGKTVFAEIVDGRTVAWSDPVDMGHGDGLQKTEDGAILGDKRGFHKFTLSFEGSRITVNRQGFTKVGKGNLVIGRDAQHTVIVSSAGNKRRPITLHRNEDIDAGITTPIATGQIRQGAIQGVDIRDGKVEINAGLTHDKDTLITLDMDLNVIGKRRVKGIKGEMQGLKAGMTLDVQGKGHFVLQSVDKPIRHKPEVRADRPTSPNGYNEPEGRDK